MATYNFTIRATDNVGAYADRNFSINVNNTIYDRFVAVGNAGLARSPDGVNWLWEAGLSGEGVAFGGGKWLVWNGTTFRSSPDGTSWTNYTPTFTGASVGGVSRIKYRIANSTWVAHTYYFNGSSYSYDEFSSTDAVTWARSTNIFTGGGNTLSYATCDFDHDAAGNCVAYLNGGATFYKPAASSTWTSQSISGLGQISASTFWGNVRNYNGLWIISAGSSNVATSVDGTNWVGRATGAAQYGLLYLNGRILSLPTNTGANTSATIRESLTAGRSWAGRTGATASNNLPYGLLTGTGGNTYKQPMCYFGGTLLAHSNGNTALSRSVDDGLTFTSFAPAGSSGVFNAIAARDGIS
jgi:hypothetical protein